MRKNRVVEQNRCYHLVSRLAHRAFFLDDEEKDRAVALMRSDQVARRAARGALRSKVARGRAVQIRRAVFCLCMVESDLENHEYGWLSRNRSWILHEGWLVRG